MNREFMNVKEEAILFAKEKVEDAAEALSEFLPDASEELEWFREELEKEIQNVRSQYFSVCDSRMFSEEEAV